MEIVDRAITATVYRAAIDRTTTNIEAATARPLIGINMKDAINTGAFITDLEIALNTDTVAPRPGAAHRRVHSAVSTVWRHDAQRIATAGKIDTKNTRKTTA